MKPLERCVLAIALPIKDLLRRLKRPIGHVQTKSNAGSDQWNTWGVRLAEEGLFDEARYCFDRALQTDDRSAKTWYNKGLCLKNLRRYEEAFICFNQALKLQPCDPTIQRKYKDTLARIKPPPKQCEKPEQITPEQKRNRLRRANAFNLEEAARIDANCRSRKGYLLNLTSRQFEDAIAKLFRDKGYRVTQTPYSNDGGKDAIAYKDGKKFAIECKQWKEDSTVGRPMLQRFFAAMYGEQASGGFFVTTAVFSVPAIEYAAANNIELVDGVKLATWMLEAYPKMGEGDAVRQMCVECNATVVFTYANWNTKLWCPNGHTVINRVTKEGEYLGIIGLAQSGEDG